MKLIVIEERYVTTGQKEWWKWCHPKDIWNWWAKLHPNDFLVIMSD